jgi:tol-pal system protein YbgF
MRRMGVAVAVAGALLLAPAAGWAANKEQQQLMAELRMLQQDQQQLRQMLVALTDALKTVNGRLDEQAATSRKALADQRLLIEGMTDNVRILRERADDTNVRLGSITQELEALRHTMGTLSQQAPANVPPMDPAGDPMGAFPPATAGPVAPPVAPPPGVSPQRTYDSAYSDYAAGRYDLAIEGFETFLRFFPRHINADDAQLNIGNSLYNAGRYTDAIGAYQRVISDYPTADSVPQAHYKLGLTYNTMKQVDQARRSFERVVTEHPASREAVLARQALDRLPKQ